MTNGLSTPVENGAGAEQAILEHARKNFSLPKSDVDVTSIPPEDLPAGVAQYYLEQKGSHGNINYNYLVFNNQIFCSGVNGDFERFLKSYGFLEKRPDVKQFVKVLRLLSIKQRDLRVLDEKRIGNPPEELQPYAAQVSAPRMTPADGGGVAVTFFTTTLSGGAPEKWVVRVAPDYTVNISHNALSQAK